ncbi:hypothetical protein ES705_12283 [subsurface metagenome]
MAIRKDSFHWYGKIDGVDKTGDSTSQSIEDLVLGFLKESQNIPKRRFIIARNQILSLYRRMKIYPENKALRRAYIDQIKQLIKLERGNEK